MVILTSSFLSYTILKGHLADNLGYHFSRVIGVSENKITKTRSLDFNPTIPGYEFEYFPTPLAAGGVDMYVKSDLNYTVIAKSSEDASQALWIESHLSNCPDINLWNHMSTAKLPTTISGIF